MFYQALVMFSIGAIIGLIIGVGLTGSRPAPKDPEYLDSLEVLRRLRHQAEDRGDGAKDA